jgi:hypothetical protein
MGRTRFLRVGLSAGAAVVAAVVSVVLLGGPSEPAVTPSAVETPASMLPSVAESSASPSAYPSPSLVLVSSPVPSKPAMSKAPTATAPPQKLKVTSFSVSARIDSSSYTATVRVQLAGSGKGTLVVMVYYPGVGYKSVTVTKKYSVSGPGTVVKTITLPTSVVCARYDPKDYQRGYFVDVNGQVLHPLQGSKDAKVECVTPV